MQIDFWHNILRFTTEIKIITLMYFVTKPLFLFKLIYYYYDFDAWENTVTKFCYSFNTFYYYSDSDAWTNTVAKPFLLFKHFLQFFWYWCMKRCFSQAFVSLSTIFMIILILMLEYIQWPNLYPFLTHLLFFLFWYMKRYSIQTFHSLPAHLLLLWFWRLKKQKPNFISISTLFIIILKNEFHDNRDKIM